MQKNLKTVSKKKKLKQFSDIEIRLFFIRLCKKNVDQRRGQESGMGKGRRVAVLLFLYDGKSGTKVFN